MPSNDSRPRRCSDCGAALHAGDLFCATCGSPADDASAAHDGVSAEDRAWLRRRVADLHDEGWETVTDRGDRVVLRKREVGRLPIHAGLFLLTGGLGNLVYALYRFTSGAPRRAVHADGTERTLSGGGASIDIPTVVAAVVAGLLTLAATVWVGIGVLANLSAVALAVGALVFVLLAFAAATIPRLVRDGRKSVTTFGRERSVDRDRVRTPPDPCAACGRRVVRGEHRRYAERLYVAGLPVATPSSGENTYCASCAEAVDAPAKSGDSGVTEGEADPVEAELERIRTETNGGTARETDRQSDAERESERP